jgi:glycosyltransferase involved in cell wall biosynthesis
MKRILLVMMQPPGSSGVQGLIYNKILPYVETYGWEFHFAGPSPELASVKTEAVPCPAERLHYTPNISWSRRFSVLKNREPKKSPLYLLYGVGQLLSAWIEKLLHHDPQAHLLRGLAQTVRQADRQCKYDLIAGKSPDFFILETVAKISEGLGKPLVAMVVDPYGKRDGAEFYPYEAEKQKNILNQSCGAMFMSPLTRDRYVRAGLVSASKAHAFTDSYPSSDYYYQPGRSRLAASRAGDSAHRPNRLQLAHLGMIPEWRPIDTMLAAIEALAEPISLDVFGYVYPEAQKQIADSSKLRQQIHCHTPVSYDESHFVAEDCDLLLVVIGPRHLDNQPSKFFEYLGHHKPMLVLGPLGNPIETIVQELGIGLYCDILNQASITEGLLQLARDYDHYVRSYHKQRQGIEAYSAEQVAKHWCQYLDAMLTHAKAAPIPH